MKQSLQLKLGQQLTMTPQLQQAIRLLQLSTLDLQQEIQQALESNPMLELNDEVESQTSETSPEHQLESASASDSSQTNADNSPQTAADGQTGDNSADFDQDDSQWQEQIPNELPVDTQWDDIYQHGYK